jgi:hypothetical protein
VNTASSLTPFQRDAIEAARLALAAEKNAPEHTTGPAADGVWRDEFRRVLEKIAAAWAEDES